VTDDERIAYLAGQLENRLDPAESAELAELDQMRALLADPAMWAEPSADLEDRVTLAVTQAAAEEARAAATDARAAAAEARQAASSAAGSGKPVRTWKDRRLIGAVAGLAAAAIIAVALTLGLSSGGSAPTRFHAALAGTSLSPGASGQVTLTKTVSGWRIALHATGLPRLDNGQYYEAWLKNSSGILVPIGTFNQPDNVTLWSGVPPTDFPGVTVTKQLANGNPASSGQRVLVGTAVPAR
jgi:Anti-sigma-K factor rskA, C-terminal